MIKKKYHRETENTEYFLGMMIVIDDSPMFLCG